MPRSSGGSLLAVSWSWWSWRSEYTSQQRKSELVVSYNQTTSFCNNHISHSTSFSAKQESSHRLSSLSTLLQKDVFCRTCVSKFVDENSKQTVRVFVTYLQNNSVYHITMAEKCDSFLKQALLEKSVMQPLIVVSLDTYARVGKCRQNNMFDLPRKTSCLTRIFKKLQ